MAPSVDLVEPMRAGEDGPVIAGKAATVEDVADAVDEAAAQTQGGDTADGVAVPKAAPRFASGMIYPPPDLRSIVDKTARFVARSGAQFEAKIRESEKTNSKFAFLNENDPYHAYYRHQIELAKSGAADGGVTPAGAGSATPGQAVAEIEKSAMEETAKAEESKPEEPEPYEFSVDLPTITAMDLDILKLTALFTAQKGRAFTQALAQRESRSFQFDFLKPTHSLFGYFNRLVGQYSRVLMPPEGTEEGLERWAGKKGRWNALEDAKKRVEWERWMRERRRKKEEQGEKEKQAFAEIDWQDFVVVATVEFTDQDEYIDLPPPLSLSEVENMSIAQKRMAAMIMETEAGAADQSPAASEAVGQGAATTKPEADEGDVEMDMEDSDVEEESAAEERAAEKKEPEVVRPLPTVGAPNMKIRTDYVPKTLANKNKVITTTCTICGQQIPVDEMSEHVRIELLDPKYREQAKELERRRAQQAELNQGADPSRFLQKFAASRTDIFGAKAAEEARRKREEEENQRRREKEKIVWDGHANSRIATKDRFLGTANLEEQIANINKRHMLNVPESNIGPQMGPSRPAPGAGGEESSSASPLPDAFAAAISSAEASVGHTPSGKASPQPPVPEGGVAPSAGPSEEGAGARAGAAPAIHPSRLAAMSHTRPREEDESDAATAGEPPAKRQTLQLPTKVPGQPLMAESEWMRYHPENISVQVTLPDAPDVASQCDGTTFVLQDLPPTLLVTTLRDRVHAKLEGAVAASKLKLTMKGSNTVLTLSKTLAAYNMEESDEVVVSLRDAKKK